jgi:hypothetical protein
MSSNEKVIEAATLALKADYGDDPDDFRVIDRAIVGLPRDDLYLVWFAYKILCGRPCSIDTDNADRVQRYYELARELGATALQEVTNEWADVRSVSVTFVPATRN